MSVVSAAEKTAYPVIETSVAFGGREYVLPQCCFQGLLSADRFDLAGMGLCIVGNLCQYVHAGRIPPHADAKLELRVGPGAAGIALPWPGMPTDDPIPLDLTKLPFNYAMFIDHEGNGAKHVDRLALMQRIEAVWVPHLLEVIGKDIDR